MWKLFDRNGAEKKAPTTVVSPAIRLSKSGNTSTATGAETTVPFDVETFKTVASMHDNATNNTRIVIPVSGVYHVAANIGFVLGASAQVAIQLLKNGVAFDANVWGNSGGSAGGPAQNFLETILQLNAGDYLEIQGRQDSGSAANIGAGGTWFEVAKIDGAIPYYVPSGPGAIGGGWDQINANLAYVSADGHTFVVSSDQDLTGAIPLGARIRLTHAATTKYFIVTAITATQLTLYGGTDYSLAAGAISAPYWSMHKAPFGFPLSPAKWTEELIDSVDRQQSSPTQNVWYNIGSLKLDIPIGAWRVYYSTYAFFSGPKDVYATLSTGSSTESDSTLTTRFAASDSASNTIGREKHIIAASKTSYYLNGKTGGTGSTVVGWSSSLVPVIIRAVCAYL